MEQSQAKKHLPWAKFGFEGVLIVVSILAAFGIDAWWDARTQSSESYALQTALKVEFDEMEKELEFSISRNNIIITAADSLLAQLRIESSSMDVSSAYLGALLLTPTTDPSHGTVDALIATGRLEILPSKPLQYLLANWPAVLEDVREEELAAKKFVHEQLTPYLGRTTDLSTVFAWRLEERRNVGNVSKQTDEAMVRISIDSELINLIETRRYLASYVLTNYSSLEASFDRIRAELAK